MLAVWYDFIEKSRYTVCAQRLYSVELGKRPVVRWQINTLFRWQIVKGQ